MLKEPAFASFFPIFDGIPQECASAHSFSVRIVTFEKDLRKKHLLYYFQAPYGANIELWRYDMDILVTENLKKYYRMGENVVKALDGVSLSIQQGEFLAIVGKSGSGKSTLLHMLGGLDQPTSGKVMIGQKDISAMDKDELTIFRRRKIGFVFQNYNLLPLMNVYENIVLPIKLDGIRPQKSHVNEIIKMLGLEDKKSAMPSQLSGGQQQRVALARALAAKPAIILADEPTGNLDSRTSQDVLGLIKTSSERFGQTVVMITHNNEIAQMAGRIIRMEDGKIRGGGKAYDEDQ